MNITKLINNALSKNSIHEFYPEFKKIIALMDVSEFKNDIAKEFCNALQEKFDERKIYVDESAVGQLNTVVGYRVLSDNDALLYYLYLFFPYYGNKHLNYGETDPVLLWKIFVKGIDESKFIEPQREHPYSANEIYDICDMLNAEFDYAPTLLTKNDTVLILNDTALQYGTSFFRGIYNGMLVSTILLPVPNDGFKEKGITDSDLLFHELGNDLAFKYSKGANEPKLFEDLPISIDNLKTITPGMMDAVSELLGFGLISVTPYKHLTLDIKKEIGEDEQKQELFYELMREKVKTYIDKIKKIRTYN